MSLFIPPQYVEAIEQRAHRDPYSDEWTITGAEYAANNARDDYSEVDRAGVTRRRTPPLAEYMPVTMAGHAGISLEEANAEKQAQLHAAMAAMGQSKMPRENVYRRYNAQEGPQ